MTDQLAPHSIEAEEAVLGSLLLNPATLVDVAPLLQPEDFYVVRHAWLYEAIRALDERGDPIDFTTVVNELEQQGRIEEIGGAAYVLNLINNTTTALHAVGYARIVARQALRRQLIVAASKVAQAAHDTSTEDADLGTTAMALIEEAVRDRGRRRTYSMEEVVDQTLAMMEETAEGARSSLFVSTGLPDVDALLDYMLWTGHLLGVYGVEKVGKTRMVSELAFHCNKRVLFYCGETRPMTITYRMAQAATQLARGQIRDNVVWRDDSGEMTTAQQVFGAAVADLQRAPIRWVYGAASLPELRQQALAYGAEVVIVDSLRRLAEVDLVGKGFQSIKDAWAGCEALAKEHDLLVVAVSEQTKEEYGRRGTGKGLYGTLPYEVDHLLYLFDEDAGKIGKDAPRVRTIEVTVPASRHVDTGGRASYQYDRWTQRVWTE